MCKRAICVKTGILCSGVCGRVYHCTDKYSGFDQYSSKVLESNPFMRWFVQYIDCVQYIHNVDVVLGEIQDGVNKNKITKRFLKRDMRKGSEKKRMHRKYVKTI